MSLKDTLRGTGVALVTPFSKKGAIDFNAFEALLEFVIRGGVEYLIPLGTTGETPTLEKSEKIDIINFVYEKVDNRVPVVVGVGGNNTNEVLKDLEDFPLDNGFHYWNLPFIGIGAPNSLRSEFC